MRDLREEELKEIRRVMVISSWVYFSLLMLFIMGVLFYILTL